MIPSRLAPTSFLALAEARVAARMQEDACRQRFDGTLVVDPGKVYIDRSTGRRALAKCREILKNRSLPAKG